MARHRLAPEAEAELDEIWFHLARDSDNFEIADHIIDSITERFWLLAQRPHIGRARDDLRPGLRSFPVGDYVIIYRTDGKNVLVLTSYMALGIFRGYSDIKAFKWQTWKSP